MLSIRSRMILDFDFFLDVLDFDFDLDFFYILFKIKNTFRTTSLVFKQFVKKLYL